MNYEKKNERKNGKVWLVGAGPSDIELLTIKGKRLLEIADVIVYDRLVGQGILTLGKQDATYINVGKSAGNHLVPQEEINNILIREAKKGQRVVRLKGGDPFVFGRGSEEVECLQMEGIPFEIIPGITSAVAVSTYAGIPVTHRDVASSLHIITAHKKKGSVEEIQFEALAKGGGTLVFLMGVSNLERICKGLLNAGMDKKMPAVIIERGTTAKQRRIEGTLETLEANAVLAKVISPAIILVGKVCEIQSINWREQLSLSAKKVIITRPENQSSNLANMLRIEGAEVLELPTIRVVQKEKRQQFVEILTNIKNYTWLVFTSPTGVAVFFEQLQKNHIDIRQLSSLKIAGVGKGTEKALEEHGFYLDIIPKIFDGEHLGEALYKCCTKEDRILIPRSKIGGQKLIEILKKSGANITDLPIYDIEYIQFDYIDYKREFEEKITDYAVFTSVSTVKGFVAATKGLDYSLVHALCIGKQTEEAASAVGMHTSVAKEATLLSLVELIREK